MAAFSCKNCPDRTYDCHTKCKKYIKEKETYEDAKSQKNNSEILHKYVNSRRSETRNRQLRKYGRSTVRFKNNL